MNARQEPESKPPDPRALLFRYASMGLELAGAIVGLTLVGLWVDYAFGTAPIGVLVGACLGVVGGLYNLIREALRMSSQSGVPHSTDWGAEDDERRDGS